MNSMISIVISLPSLSVASRSDPCVISHSGTMCFTCVFYWTLWESCGSGAIRSSMFENLIPSRWYCLGKWWNRHDVEPFWRKSIIEGRSRRVITSPYFLFSLLPVWGQKCDLSASWLFGLPLAFYCRHRLYLSLWNCRRNPSLTCFSPRYFITASEKSLIPVSSRSRSSSLPTHQGCDLPLSKNTFLFCWLLTSGLSLEPFLKVVTL